MIEIIAAARKRGKRRPRAPSGALVHVTGLGVNEAARKRGMEPHERAIEVYRDGPAFPDYLVTAEKTYSFADAEGDLVRTAHAAWRPWERNLYEAIKKWNGPRIPWAKDYRDGRVVVDRGFYADWHTRWQRGGRFYSTPMQIVEKIGGPGASPNETMVGVEMTLPITPAHLRNLAALFVELARRHGWFDPAKVNPEALPQPWLCGHDDVCPARRWKRVKGSPSGTGWDPGPRFDWLMLGQMIVEAAS